MIFLDHVGRLPSSGATGTTGIVVYARPSTTSFTGLVPTKVVDVQRDLDCTYEPTGFGRAAPPPRSPACLPASLDRLGVEIRRQAAETGSHGWDDDGAVPTAGEDWDATWTFARRAAEFPNLPEASVAPCADGSIHLTWYGGGRRLTIERRAAQIFYSLALADGTFDDGRCESDLDALSILRKAFS